MKFNPKYSLEGLMLKLKFKYFGHLLWRAYSFLKPLMLGKIKGKGRRGWQRMIWLDGITDTMDINLSKLQDSGGQRSLAPWTACCSSWGFSIRQLSDSITSAKKFLPFLEFYFLFNFCLEIIFEVFS